MRISFLVVSRGCFSESARLFSLTAVLFLLEAAKFFPLAAVLFPLVVGFSPGLDAGIFLLKSRLFPLFLTSNLSSFTAVLTGFSGGVFDILSVSGVV